MPYSARSSTSPRRGDAGPIGIGCCGFPRRLEEHACTFSVVEVQQTFYRLPRPGTAARYRTLVPAGFEFTMKASQLITHPPTSPTYRRLRRAVPEARRNRYGCFQRLVSGRSAPNWPE